MKYSKEPSTYIDVDRSKIASFEAGAGDNMDAKTVDSFGEEWSKFAAFNPEEIQKIGDEYFDILPDDAWGEGKSALDVGCGSGRWTLYIKDKFSEIEAVDPSSAVFIAEKNTQAYSHIRVTKAGVDQLPFENNSFDFVFSLGVLHHIPDTAAAMAKAVEKLKNGGYFLVYLYYALDNRGFLYKLIFNTSTIFRRVISIMPSFIKRILCDIIAILVYLPFVGLANLLKMLSLKSWVKIPLSYYVGKSFFVIRNDALDRFGTPLEQRFTKQEIHDMMTSAGLSDIQFSSHSPYWHAVGKKA